MGPLADTTPANNPKHDQDTTAMAFLEHAPSMSPASPCRS